MYICICMYVYIYIYRERERERLIIIIIIPGHSPRRPPQRQACEEGAPNGRALV